MRQSLASVTRKENNTTATATATTKTTAPPSSPPALSSDKENSSNNLQSHKTMSASTRRNEERPQKHSRVIAPSSADEDEEGDNNEISLGESQTQTTQSTQHGGNGATMSARQERRKSSQKRRHSQSQTQSGKRRKWHEIDNTKYYDPDQDPAKRREIRKKFRTLASNFHDSRNEFVKVSSQGIDQTVRKANKLFQSVKNTPDATIDSNLLVSVADLSYKRTSQAVLGDSAASIDIEEFISKCISYMRQEAVDQNVPMSTQNHRRRTTRSNLDDEDDDDDDDDEEHNAEDDDEELNWDWLGRRACLPSNSRPAVCGFLLGPMSVKKRTRQMTQRRARQERVDSSQAVRPQELKQDDLETQETLNLTELCASIHKLLTKSRIDAVRQVDHLCQERPGLSPDEVYLLANENGLSDNGGVPLFKFCINPRSFGQSVENLFYVSFLVRDGIVGIDQDTKGLPTLMESEPSVASEASRKGIQKQQGVFSLDFDSWRDLIAAFDIRKSIIPHRKEPHEGDTNAAPGWYS